MFTYQEIKDNITLEDADSSCFRGMTVTKCAVLESVEDISGHDLAYVISQEYQDCFCMSAREAYFLLRVGKDTQRLYTYFMLIQLCDKKAA